MDIVNVKKILVTAGGSSVTTLELQYEDRLLNSIAFGGIESASKWLTYNQVIIELKKTNCNETRLKEILYRLTDGENPNDVFMSVLNGVVLNAELDRLYNKIINF